MTRQCKFAIVVPYVDPLNMLCLPIFVWSSSHVKLVELVLVVRWDMYVLKQTKL